MAVDTLAKIDAELKRAATPRTSRKQVFLFLSPGQKALVRPIYNLNAVPTLDKHFKWSENRDYRVDAICAYEIGETCELCEAAKEEKKLTASATFFVPVYVYGVVNIETGAKVTYKDPETQQDKPLVGFRILELSAFGKISAVLKHFRSYHRDDESHDITTCDFTIELSGAGNTKDYIVTPKAPKAMHPQIRAKAPSLDAFRQAIIEARPPQVVQMVSDSLELVVEGETETEEASDAIPEF